MTLKSKLASFAHLAGIGTPAAPAAPAPESEEIVAAAPVPAPQAASAEDDEDPKKKRDDETEDEYASRMKKMDEDKPSPKDDEDRDEDMRGQSAAAQARRCEQARCAAIFASPAAARNPVLAAKLAFNTRMPRSEAVAVLEGSPAPALASGGSARAAANPNLPVGPAGRPGGKAAVDQGWDRAASKYRRTA